MMDLLRLPIEVSGATLNLSSVFAAFQERLDDIPSPDATPSYVPILVSFVSGHVSPTSSIIPLAIAFGLEPASTASMVLWSVSVENVATRFTTGPRYISYTVST
jgi:hypothetical protein